MKINQKTALVTGASSGIGKATVELLLENGYRVYGAARRVDKMADLKDMGADVLAMDLTEDSSIVDGVNQIIQEHGGVDILVNNAGYGSYGAIEDVDMAEAMRQFEVNVFGLARLTQLVLPKMRANRYGKIVNITSMGGKIYTPLGGWYHATKFAVEGLSDCLRFETKQFGIDVIVVEPGVIKTEWGEVALDGLQKTSGNTAYSDLAQKVRKLFQDSYNDPKASEPKVIADVIIEAITAKRPKPRYVAGHMAKTFLFMRKILSDRMFDRLLSYLLK